MSDINLLLGDELNEQISVLSCLPSPLTPSPSPLLELAVNHQFSSVKYLSPKQLLVERLQSALNLYIYNCGISAPQLNCHCLNRARHSNQVLYVCAIALQLSKTLKLPAGEIAQSLAELVLHQSDGQDFSVLVVSPGLIYIELTQSYLAALLQSLAQTPSRLCCLTKHGDQRKTGDFQFQYAHARCCSILQLADRQELITLEPTDSNQVSALWQIVTPKSIPWFNGEHCLSHPAQLALISQLLIVLDALYCPCPSRQSVNWHKVALNLSQAFQTFYSQCRIWGEVKSQNIQLAQARLGLVLITQSVLRLLLQDYLGIIAPSEL